MTTHEYQPQQFVTPPQPPAAPLVTFASERRIRHAATLFIVVTYIWLGLMGLFFLLAVAGVAVL